MKTFTLSALALTALSACGGSSGGGSDFVEGPRFASLNEGLSDIETLNEQAERLGTTPIDALGTTGSAEYNGSLFIGMRTGTLIIDAVVGEMDLAVDLATNSVDGSVSNFQGRSVNLSSDIGSGPREGEIAITDGSLIRAETGSGIFAEFDGQVEFSFDSELTDVNGVLIGAFAGEGAEIITGTVFVDDTDLLPELANDPTISEIIVEGGFAAERVN